MLVYDPACDQNNEHSQGSEDSQDDEQGHNSDAHPDLKDPNPDKEENSKEEEESKEASAPGEVAGRTTTAAPENDDSAQKAASASDEVGQLADSPTTYGCPWDYTYEEELDACVPSAKDMPFLSMLGGDPWPNSVGGYVGLLGQAPAGLLTAVGWAGFKMALGHVVGGTLVDYGEGVFSPLGYGIQGLGYTIGFVGETVGLAMEGAGKILGGAGYGAEVAVNTVVDNVVTPVLEGVVKGVEAVVETVEKIGSAAKNVFCKLFC